MKMITGHDPKFIAITGRAARLSCFFVRRQLAAASLLAEELLKFILAATDCPPMVDSFLTPVIRGQCSFFNGLCYLILRISSYGAFSLTWLTGYANLLEQKKAFIATPTLPPFWHINLADETSYENPLYQKMANALSNL